MLKNLKELLNILTRNNVIDQKDNNNLANVFQRLREKGLITEREINKIKPKEQA